jgi:hypothetical protein
MADADWSKADEKALRLECKALLLEQEALMAYGGNPRNFPHVLREAIDAAWAAFEAAV